MNSCCFPQQTLLGCQCYIFILGEWLRFSKIIGDIYVSQSGVFEMPVLVWKLALRGLKSHLYLSLFFHPHPTSPTEAKTWFTALRTLLRLQLRFPFKIQGFPMEWWAVLPTRVALFGLVDGVTGSPTFYPEQEGMPFTLDNPVSEQERTDAEFYFILRLNVRGPTYC